MKGYCKCRKEIDEVEYFQFEGMCEECYNERNKRNIREAILILKERIKGVFSKLDTLRSLDQLNDSELIYHFNIKMLIQTLDSYDKYMLKKIFKIIQREEVKKNNE